MKYECVLFDLDGTLLDTLTDLTDAINHTLEAYNLPVHTKDEVRSYVGNGLRKLVERALPEGENYKDIEKFFNDFVEYYNAHNLVKTAPYPQVIETIKELYNKGIKMAIVTNKGQTASESLLKDFFYPQISVVVGDGNGRKHKPAPDNVDEAMKQLGLSDKSKILYIGDSEVDAQTAINSGLDYVLCTYGFREMDVLSQFEPIAYIDSMSKLLELF